MTNPTRVILLNGPPNVGKDTLADRLVSLTSDSCTRSFKEPMYLLLSLLHCIPLERVRELCGNRETKDEHCPEFGMSPRKAQILLSEQVIKPSYGDDWFGRRAAASLTPGFLNVFSDSGFVNEAWPIIREVGTKNILLVHMRREGCSFDQDSRDYLPTDMFPNFTEINNDSGVAMMGAQLLGRVREWEVACPS